jgi:hypothetical protein
MTMAVNTPTSRTGLAQRVSTVGVAGPSSTAVIGLLTAALGAWAGIVGYVGPVFGYHATTLGAWQWTTNNWLLHLIPGAVAFVAGLLVLGRARALARGGVSLAALAAILAGAWLVIGPAAWPLFESSRAYGPATGATNIFLVKLGADLGPGVLLAAFGGMLLKASHPGRVAAVTGAAAPAAGYEPTTTAVPEQGTTAADPATRTRRGWSGAQPAAAPATEANPPVE